MSRYAVAQTFTPILNTPKFRQVFGKGDGSGLPLDDQGLLRPVEVVAFPQTRFEVVEEKNDGILRIKTNEYQGDELYIDKRFVQFENRDPPERIRKMPNPDQLLERLKALVGTPYIWGGNCHRGIPQLLDYYPSTQPLTPELEAKWTLSGVDCSGLLYQVAEGCTPRNTSELVNYGHPLLIEGKSAKEIAALLKPLDLIVWRGHVVIVFDEKRSIESRAGQGVVFRHLIERLEEIISEREYNFVIKRWTGK